MMLFKNAQSPHYTAAAVAKQAARVTFPVERKTASVRARVVQSVCMCLCVSFTPNWQQEFPSLTSSHGVGVRLADSCLALVLSCCFE